MRPEVLMPLALLFIAQGVSSAQNAAAAAAAEESLVTVEEGAPLTVECSLRVEQSAEWRLDGAAPPADLRGGGEAAAAGGRLTARLQAAAARAHHAGLYTCARPPAQRVRVLVRARARAVPGEGETTTTLAVAAEVARAAPTPAPAAAATINNNSVPVFYYDVGRSFVLNCTGAHADSADGYEWTANGTALAQVGVLSGRYELKRGGAELHVTGRSHWEDDFGLYACAAGGATQSWDVRGRTYAKFASNTNVVEGQKLKLVCKLIGKPYPKVQWTYNVTKDNLTDVSEALGGRAVLSTSEQGVEGGQLVLEAAERGDAGQLTCWPAGGVPAATVLRVKGMYAALWPFLGICAEVFVLCAIILVYEKRRTKPELDDSDTDNHDQKKS